MKLINKQTKRILDLTADQAENLLSKSDQHKQLYEVVLEDKAPEIPKEIKKMSGKPKPESDNDGLQTTTDRLPDENAG